MEMTENTFRKNYQTNGRTDERMDGGRGRHQTSSSQSDEARPQSAKQVAPRGLTSSTSLSSAANVLLINPRYTMSIIGCVHTHTSAAFLVELAKEWRALRKCWVEMLSGELVVSRH